MSDTIDVQELVEATEGQIPAADESLTLDAAVEGSSATQATDAAELASTMLNAEVGHEPAHAEAGLPQMDVTAYPTQLFWLTVTFVLLYLLMSRSVLPRIHEVLEKRRHRIEHDLDQADTFTKDAEAAKTEYETLHHDAQDKAAHQIAAMQKAVKDEQDKTNAKLDADLSKKLDDADTAIAKSVADVKKKLAPVAGELAAEIVTLIAGKSPSEAQLADATKKVKW